MKRFVFAALCGLAVTAMADTTTFDADVVGQPPAGWTCGATGRGNPKWSVEADPTAPGKGKVLRQSGAATFPWCVKADTKVDDGWLEVKFKPISGKEDQAGGVVWRWKDGDNYYVARANALENNVSLYYTARGIRKTLKYVDAPVAVGPVARAARRLRRDQDRRLARRQALHRLRRQSHHRIGCRRCLDQGGQRDRVR